MTPNQRAAVSPVLTVNLIDSIEKCAGRRRLFRWGADEPSEETGDEPNDRRC
jgi:hypothetical protein